jgi:tRNA nucleotidyltransferase/poly(A) polymerase
MRRSHLPLFIDETFDRFGIGWALDRLRRNTAEVFIVGGAVRDALRDPSHPPTDIDLMTAGSLNEIASALGPLGVPHTNRHGNLRFELEHGRHMDLIHTRQFYGRARSVPRALEFFDASINAVAVSIADPQLIDPLGGARHLAEGEMLLPRARWRVSDPFEDVHVVLRILRLVARTGIRVRNPEVARPHRLWFANVDWADLERLNGFGREEAEARYAQVFESPEERAIHPFMETSHILGVA